MTNRPKDEQAQERTDFGMIMVTRQRRVYHCAIRTLFIELKKVII